MSELSRRVVALREELDRVMPYLEDVFAERVPDGVPRRLSEWDVYWAERCRSLTSNPPASAVVREARLEMAEFLDKLSEPDMLGGSGRSWYALHDAAQRIRDLR